MPGPTGSGDGDGRDAPQPLESPAYLGRRFPGTSGSPRPFGSAALRGLGFLFVISLIGSSLSFREGHTAVGAVFTVVMVAAVAAGFLMLRAEIRKVRLEGGRHPRRYP